MKVGDIVTHSGKEFYSREIGIIVKEEGVYIHVFYPCDNTLAEGDIDPGIFYHFADEIVMLT